MKKTGELFKGYGSYILANKLKELVVDGYKKDFVLSVI